VLEAASPSVAAGTALKLDSSKSAAGAKPIVGHVWDLDGDGSFETDTGTEPTAEVTPKTPGPLTVHVRVVDEGGQNADAKLALDVTAPAAMEPGAVVVSPSGENGSDDGKADGVGPAGPDDAEPSDANGPKDDGAPADAIEPAAPAPAPAAPETAPAPADPPKPAKPAGLPAMSAAPALVPRRVLAARARTQGKTQPVADVHAAASTGVTIKDFKFAPASISVSVGDSITWTNQDVAPHTATANDGSFDTGNLSKGKSGSITFSKAGTFAYICSIHPSMKGTVTVAAASGGSSGGNDTSGDGTSAGTTADDGSGLPHTGFNLLAVVLLASLMTGSGSLLRRRLG
jgi:plastocyanin